MKRTGILKAMRLCREYTRMSDEKREKLRSERFREIVDYAKNPLLQKCDDLRP